ncbi:hypothetical protein CDD80_6429 [Ophiocordyceps camponoti-rufipedis]|uniref:C2H2-type domain-containing protein n=1 Tax=Ophiocordyceps camponoti-rufipedis TaxID=2004952 RepID=A0A2C5ZM43_9HYPO|nr:hypothetical protein CDD80_6429 [Ophiocordyceps camponoti-rufipedis]
MFPMRPAEEANLRTLTDEDHQLLFRLVQRYGVPSLLCALTGSPDSSASSTLSASTLLSNVSAPSLAWTNRSDASINTHCTWPDDMHDSKISERSWLDSPGPVPSPTSHPSPQLAAPTSKKYQCPMCFLDNSPVGFGRKSDFKKHLHNFHGSDVVWICRTKACHLSFSTERAYSTHAKEAHRMKALPNSAARTELCAQVVFSCGFAACRDRLFEARSADDSSATRDKHFEHIAKHFEEGFDVRHWEYRVQMQNLMRQPQIKSTWKTCIWPKEKRQQLVWRPRSSADLKRILECRHLGDDMAQLVRLAYILGTAPFSSPATPPMGDVDVYFQLPYRASCLIDAPGHTATAAATVGSPKGPADDDAAGVTVPKRRSSRSSLTQSVFRLSGRQGKRASSSRPPTPATVPGQPPLPSTPVPTPTPPSHGHHHHNHLSHGHEDTVMGDDGDDDGGGGDDDTTAVTGPHPGTPFPIPSDAVWPPDAPKFAPEVVPKLNAAVDLYSPMHHQMDQQAAAWCGIDAFDPYSTIPQAAAALYDYTPPATGRPATPVPAHKRPASWGRVVSMETLRPAKKTMAAESSCPPELLPTMLSM